MSRKQWGHGYWSGVKDTATQNKYIHDMDEITKEIIAFMCRSNSQKCYDRSLFPVREFLVFCSFSGISEDFAKEIYEWVLKKEPLGCYISGNQKADWTEDYFVLPNLTEEGNNDKD